MSSMILSVNTVINVVFAKSKFGFTLKVKNLSTREKVIIKGPDKNEVNAINVIIRV